MVAVVALALLPILVVAVVLPWRMGLWTMKDPLAAARRWEKAEREATEELRRAQALHPSSTALLSTREPMSPEAAEALKRVWLAEYGPKTTRRPGQRAGKPRSGLRVAGVDHEATAILEAQALEDGALERAVEEWAR